MFLEISHSLTCRLLMIAKKRTILEFSDIADILLTRKPLTQNTIGFYMKSWVATRNFYFVSFVESEKPEKLRMNNIASTHSPVPVLTQNDSAVSYCDSTNLPDHCDKDSPNENPVCYCPHLIPLELGEVYEFLLLDDKDARPGVSHALHLHGHSFQVIDMGTRVQYSKGETAFANATHSPVIKDTVTMPCAGFVRIRFRATNPGLWYFHCHLEYHMKPGMTATIRVGNSEDFPPPPANFPTCGNFLPPVFDTLTTGNKY